jgi:hypothetical protein
MSTVGMAKLVTSTSTESLLGGRRLAGDKAILMRSENVVGVAEREADNFGSVDGEDIMRCFKSKLRSPRRFEGVIDRCRIREGVVGSGWLRVGVFDFLVLLKLRMRSLVNLVSTVGRLVVRPVLRDLE